MDWKDSYIGADSDADDDPFPKMLEDDADNLLGPFVATEVPLVEKVSKGNIHYALARAYIRKSCMSGLQPHNAR